MEDLISVIVPVYNLEKYLREALDSVINQSYKNLEIILVDDGSTDRSLNILKEYERKDERVKCFTKENGGICEAMKFGVLMSSGKYIARCDGDDINDFYRYERQLKYLKEGDFDLVGCYLKSFGNGDKSYMRDMEGLNTKIENYFDQFYRIYKNKCINGGALFGTRESFLSIMPFKKEFSIVEDRLIYLEFHRWRKKIGNLPEVLYNYRVHNSNTSLNPKNVFEMFYRNCQLVFNYLFYDFIDRAENVFIIEESNALSVIKEVVSNIFKEKSIRFIDEGEFNFFMNDEVFLYDPFKSCIFAGKLFVESVEYALRNFGYSHLENLFLII